MNHTLVYISVGSNLGDKLENCRGGIASLTQSGENELVDQSSYYRTEPVDYTDQDWFVNAAILIRTQMSPQTLLRNLKQIEQEAGRVEKTVRFGPRVLDMDILLFGDLVLDTPALTIPHPRMHRRRFVLQPICDITPHVVHPVLNRSMSELLQHLEPDSQRIVRFHD
jgi:2-amino-4-hydroxy-6-hydroxymethyldihydropteridine diphosphokinase